MQVSEGIESERYRVLSGSALKVIATLSMFVDHTALLLWPKIAPTVLSYRPTEATLVCYAMRAFGRLAFPIFVFLLVEGFVHTRDRQAYGVRLAIFAAISEVPWNLWHVGKVLMPSKQSVFVTLFFAYCGLCLAELVLRARDDTERVRAGAGLVAVFVVTHIAHSDYGAKAVGCAIAMYLLREHEALRAVVSTSCLSNPIYGLCAFVPIGLYNGERGFIRGRTLQLLFYAIYPAHMLLLWYLRFRMGVGIY